ncbi:MAG: bifunctional (p)ppGpp synthetase/guanosine-3',5'-bis(diphosphate) 3'-pyrophosphohydrolase [Bacteroidia bacterium]
MQISDAELERNRILNAYRNLLRNCPPQVTKEDKRVIRQAFRYSLESHQGMRRKSGELYIFHPLAVATICAREISLGTTSIVCALLHDVVEDTDITLEDIEGIFGAKIANIIDGLTKISGVVGKTNSMQAENFRKILLTLADDVRVILVKLADRLHNMRTLEAMTRTSQLKIASETLVLFAPLAHRLGLYAIKSELEDLALKYTEPKVYKDISQKLQSSKTQRSKYIRKFIEPLQAAFAEENLRYEIKGRTKSIYSIYNKMRQQDIPFEQVYDLFAVRIILDSEIETEKADCWQVYSIVTDSYTPNPERIRDWISTPKGNGYESLHTTVMGPQGKWVEVQIRSRRMDEIAEKGYAAHWKYKENESGETGLEEWIRKIRELLENPEANALDFLDDFKLNLFSDEVFAFSPKGDIYTLPLNATALDFAFEIHTDVGLSCLGAKVNHKLVPLSYKLKNGDQVEIITSKKQKPNEAWLKFAVTAKARSKIKAALKEDKRKIADVGKEILSRKMRSAKVKFSNDKLLRLSRYFNLPSSLDLFYNIGSGKIDSHRLKTAMDIFQSLEVKKPEPTNGKPKKKSKKILPPAVKPDMVVVGGDTDLDYSFSKCCNPIPGDDIFGFITIGDGIKIHRTNCPNGIRLMSNYGYRIIKAKWAAMEIKDVKTFPVGVRLIGFDSLGIVSRITDIVSKELKVNMQSITVESKDGAFEGSIILLIYDTEHLEQLIQKIKKISGIDTVSRFDVEETLPQT